MAPERFKGGADRPAFGRLRADVCALRMPDGTETVFRRQSRAAARRTHGAPTTEAVGHRSQALPHSTTSSPRAWPRSRAGAINRRAKSPQPRAARPDVPVPHTGRRVGIRRAAPRLVTLSRPGVHETLASSSPRCCWVMARCSAVALRGGGDDSESAADHLDVGDAAPPALGGPRRDRRRPCPPTSRRREG